MNHYVNNTRTIVRNITGIFVPYNWVNIMYDNVKSLGISNPQHIDRYSLRQEANNDILKIYYRKEMKANFSLKALSLNTHSSVKPLQRQTVAII